MRLRIVRPLPHEIEGIKVDRFLFGATYEIEPPLGDLLLMLGYAVLEDLDRSAPTRRAPGRRTRKR